MPRRRQRRAAILTVNDCCETVNDCCEACGTQSPAADNGITVCPHCDVAHQCKLDDPTCRKLAVWFGRKTAK